MEQKGFLHTLLREERAPAELIERVQRAIRHAERARARMRLGMFSGLSVFFGAALVPAFQYALDQFSASGFSSYLSLIFSDSSLVVSLWRELGLSLVESLPALSLLILLPLAFAFVWSIVRSAKIARTAFA